MNLQMKISPKHKEGDITPGSDYRYHPYGDSAITAISTAKASIERLIAMITVSVIPKKQQLL